MSMMRGELTTVIYDKLLSLSKIEESAALTLISTDVQRIAQTFHFLLINTMPSAVQLVIAIYLLYTQISTVCIAPVIVALGTTRNPPSTPMSQVWFDTSR
jgi:ABC-type siderophore export system fused ATPase/permease subunit